MITKMSTMIPCPQCGTKNRFPTFSVINVEDQPDRRDAILERTLSQETCENCGTQYRGPPEFSYFDRRRHQWIDTFPWDQRDGWRAAEQEARSMYDVYAQSDTSLAVRMRKAPLNRRVTFGWEALREKLVAARHKLDDVTLELLKSEVSRQSPGQAEGDSDLRLLEADKAQLTFGRIVPPAEEIVDRIAVPRAQYDSTRDDPALRKLRDELSQEMYVDLRRLK